MALRHVQIHRLGAGEPNSAFTGGIDYDSSPYEMRPDCSPDCSNVLPQTNVGSIQTRTGRSKFNTAAITGTTGVVGLQQFFVQGATPTEKFVCQHGTGVYNNTPEGTWAAITGALTITSSNTNLVSYAVLNNVLICANRSRDALYQYTGTGNATAVGGSPPNGRYVANFQRRIFLGGNSTSPLLLYYSAQDNQASWTTASDFLNFDEGQGVEITGIVAVGPNTLVVFKNKSIHIVQPTGSFPPFTRQLLRDGIGCVSQQSIVTLPNGTIVWWDDNDIYQMSGFVIDSVTQYPLSGQWTLLGWVNRLPRFRKFFNTLVNTSNLPYVVGVYYPLLGIVRWYYSSTNSSTNDQNMDMHVKTLSFWPGNLLGAAACVRIINSQPRLMVGNYSGFVYQEDKTFSDDGVAIAMKYSAAWQFHEGTNIRKKCFEFKATLARNQNFNPTANIYLDFNSAVAVTGSMSIANVTGSQWDVDSWDIGNWVIDSVSSEAAITVNRMYKGIRTEIVYSGLNQPITIHDMSVLERPLEITRQTN